MDLATDFAEFVRESGDGLQRSLVAGFRREL